MSALKASRYTSYNLVTPTTILHVKSSRKLLTQKNYKKMGLFVDGNSCIPSTHAPKTSYSYMPVT